jgi:hypothetical protein
LLKVFELSSHRRDPRIKDIPRNGIAAELCNKDAVLKLLVMLIPNPLIWPNS